MGLPAAVAFPEHAAPGHIYEMETMRRAAFVLLTATMLLAAAATPAAAATDHYRYSVHGAGAWASGVSYAGDRFNAFWVEIGDEATIASDGESYLSYVLFERLREICDGDGCTSIYTSGWAENVPFQLDRKKFTTANVRVRVPAVRCTDSGRTQTCRETTVRIRVSWAGFGPMIRSHGTSSGGISGEYQYTLNGAATERWADVSGSIGTFDLSNAEPIGAMYRTRYAERTIIHG